MTDRLRKLRLWTRSVRRLLAVAAGAGVLAAAMTLWLWGTDRRLATASGQGAGYEWIDTWESRDFPSGEIERPMGIAAAPGGDVYLISGEHRVLRLSPEGEFIGLAARNSAARNSLFSPSAPFPPKARGRWGFMLTTWSAKEPGRTSSGLTQQVNCIPPLRSC